MSTSTIPARSSAIESINPATEAVLAGFEQFTPEQVEHALAEADAAFHQWRRHSFAAPTLMAGNTAVLKHASNVPQCALAIEEVFRDAGFPRGALRTVLVPGGAVEAIIDDPRVRAVTLTGSNTTGEKVAAAAGRAIKKTVLELGGSDPFVVLDDADLAAAAAMAVRSRFQNGGQSCIAAKRFIVVASVAEEFERRFVEGIRKLEVGDPTDRSVDVGPLARADLRETVDRQARVSVAQGARVVLGGAPLPGRGYFYQPTLVLTPSPPLPFASLRAGSAGPHPLAP